MGRKKEKKITVSGNFTTAEELVKSFLKVTGPRQKAKAKGESSFKKDAGYWEGGQCDWGGSHKLDEDSKVLADFFNSIASISDDMNKIKLSANEQVFNSNKQQLISKLQGLISKCQITSSTSIGNICCIWNDFFGNFLKKYLDNFSAKLRRNLGEIEKLEPKHQKDLLDLEKEAREAESAYKENLQKANNENDPNKKAEFIVLANKAAKRAEELKRKIKNNPIAQLASFNFLDDLRTLVNGNLQSTNVTPDRKPKGNGLNNGNNNSSGGRTKDQIPNPLSDPKNFWEQNKTMVIVAIVLLILMLYISMQKDNSEHEEDKKFTRQLAMAKAMSNKKN